MALPLRFESCLSPFPEAPSYTLEAGGDTTSRVAKGGSPAPMRLAAVGGRLYTYAT